jgi:hypothetical protein
VVRLRQQRCAAGRSCRRRRAQGVPASRQAGRPRRRGDLQPTGKAIGFIKLPERCANLCFGGPKNNRLYMASCHSLYALYVEAHGAI